MKKVNTLNYTTVADVANRECVTVKTVYVWINENKISPVFYIGKNKKTILIGLNYKIIASKTPTKSGKKKIVNKQM